MSKPALMLYLHFLSIQIYMVYSTLMTGHWHQEDSAFLICLLIETNYNYVVNYNSTDEASFWWWMDVRARHELWVSSNQTHHCPWKYTTVCGCEFTSKLPKYFKPIQKIKCSRWQQFTVRMGLPTRDSALNTVSDCCARRNSSNPMLSSLRRQSKQTQAIVGQ